MDKYDMNPGARKLECRLTDCSQNEDKYCKHTNPGAEPLLEVMSFSGFCPEYDGERYPKVRDESRKGKSIFRPRNN